MSRSSKGLDISRASLVVNGLLRYDGKGLSCPTKNAPTLDSQGNLTINGRIKQQSSAVRISGRHEHTLSPEYTLILVDSDKGPITLTLPSVADALDEVEYVIKDSGGRASKCPITVQTASRGDMIQTGHSFEIDNDYGIVRLLCDGSKWLLMSEVTQLRPWRVQFV